MSSKSQPNTPTLYLDRNLGSKIIPGILKSHGIPCEIHDEHLPQDAADPEWINLCSDKNWIAITRDAKIRYNSVILDAIKNSHVGIFILTSKTLTGEEQAQVIVKAYKKIAKFQVTHPRPFVARISQQGKIVFNEEAGKK